MKKLSAYEWGLKHKSCPDALAAREALGPNKGQSDFYQVCNQSDWLFWQLDKLPLEKKKEIKPLLVKIANKIADRAVQTYALNCGVPKIEKWAENWLNGKDRTRGSAKKVVMPPPFRWEEDETIKLAWAAIAVACITRENTKTRRLVIVKQVERIARIARTAATNYHDIELKQNRLMISKN
jgi:hypothetical protein